MLLKTKPWALVQSNHGEPNLLLNTPRVVTQIKFILLFLKTAGVLFETFRNLS